MENARLKTELPIDRVYVKGMGGEIARAFYYRRDDEPTTTITAEDIVERLRLPKHPDLIDAAETWRRRWSPADGFELLDNLYADNRTGCWHAPQFYADPDVHSQVFPLNFRSTVEAMHALPLHVKRSDQLAPLVVARLWPELLSVPINRPFGLRGVARNAKRFVVSKRRTTRAHDGQ